MDAFLLIVLTLAVNKTVSEDLFFPEEQWKNRVLVIQTDGGNPEMLNAQMKLFSPQSPEWKERKLKLVLFNGKAFYTFHSNGWKEYTGQVTYNSSLKEIITDKILLIGLDGSIKFESPLTVGEKDIFQVIDGMPMRKIELKKTTQGN